jgi:hypothetical protein
VPRARVAFVATAYGSRLPRDRGRPIHVEDGEVVEKLIIEVPRSGAIEGRVVNEDGEPVPWARVNALLAFEEAREPVAPGNRETDDLGRFRIFGLAPGEYYLKAEVAGSNEFGPGLDPNPLAYVPAFYPNAIAPEEAQKLTLESGTEIGGIEIQVRRTRTHTVSGVVVAGDGGKMSRAFVSFFQGERDSRSTVSDGEGSFSCNGLLPGQYTVIASTPFSPNEDGTEPEISSPIAVSVEQDVHGLTLPLRRGSKARGRVVFEVDGEKPAGIVRVLAMAPPESRGNYSRSVAGSSEAVVKDDGTFQLSRLFGAQLFRIGEAPPGIRIKSVMWRGNDITDVPTEVGDVADPPNLVITVTNRGAQLAGRVVDAKGEPVPDGIVMLFAADEKRWATWSQSLQTTNVDEKGRFSLNLLRADKYLIAAVDPSSMSTTLGFSDASNFARIAEVATPLELLENDARQILLTIARLPR